MRVLRLKGTNSTLARCRHLTTTTRINFVFPLLFKCLKEKVTPESAFFFLTTIKKYI